MTLDEMLIAQWFQHPESKVQRLVGSWPGSGLTFGGEWRPELDFDPTSFPPMTRRGEFVECPCKVGPKSLSLMAMRPSPDYAPITTANDTPHNLTGYVRSRLAMARFLQDFHSFVRKHVHAWSPDHYLNDNPLPPVFGNILAHWFTNRDESILCEESFDDSAALRFCCILTGCDNDGGPEENRSEGASRGGGALWNLYDDPVAERAEAQRRAYEQQRFAPRDAGILKQITAHMNSAGQRAVEASHIMALFVFHYAEPLWGVDAQKARGVITDAGMKFIEQEVKHIRSVTSQTNFLTREGAKQREKTLMIPTEWPSEIRKAFDRARPKSDSRWKVGASKTNVVDRYSDVTSVLPALEVEVYEGGGRSGTMRPEFVAAAASCAITVALSVASAFQGV